MKENYKKIRIRMDRSFKKFMEEEVNVDFINALSILAGIDSNEITEVVFRKGCVIFECKMPKEAVDRLKELYSKRNNKNDCEDIEELRDFITEFIVVDVTDDFEVKVNINKSNKNKILFVHGWRGDSDSFGKMPEILSNKIGCESLIYEYPTGIWERSPSIHYISKNLDNWIRNHANDKKLAIICHSMGGIIVRDLLVSQTWRNKPLDELIKQITFIASPHSGVPMAKLGKYVPLIRKAQISDLSTKSPFLVNLNNQWSQWSRANVPDNCTTRSIYGLSDSVVDQSLAIGDDPEAVPIPNAGHIDIVKPEKPTDEVVITVKRFINESMFVE